MLLSIPIDRASTFSQIAIQNPTAIYTELYVNTLATDSCVNLRIYLSPSITSTSQGPTLYPPAFKALLLKVLSAAKVRPACRTLAAFPVSLVRLCGRQLLALRMYKLQSLFGLQDYPFLECFNFKIFRPIKFNYRLYKYHMYNAKGLMDKS
jgi:hypothetical protein